MMIHVFCLFVSIWKLTQFGDMLQTDLFDLIELTRASWRGSLKSKMNITNQHKTQDTRQGRHS